MSNTATTLVCMTTASTNGATRATRRVVRGNEMSTNTEHTPSSVWPQPTSITAYLRDNARHGATLVTRNGISVVETGHAVNRYMAQPPKSLAYRMTNRGVIGSTATLGHSQNDLLRGDISEQ
jgi:hypothetical protein